jgi:hypothetical protein
MKQMKDSESEDEEVVSVDSELNEYNPDAQ